MRCEKCKYITKTTCKCHFGYEQASKEFVDENCEKFIDKYKEEYTPVIAREIIAEIEKKLKSVYVKWIDDNFYKLDGYELDCVEAMFNKDLDLAEFKKKYTGE